MFNLSKVWVLHNNVEDRIVRTTIRSKVGAVPLASHPLLILPLCVLIILMPFVVICTLFFSLPPFISLSFPLFSIFLKYLMDP